MADFLSDAEYDAHRLARAEEYWALCAEWQGSALSAQQKRERPALLWACFLKTNSDAYLLEAVEADGAVLAYQRAGLPL